VTGVALLMLDANPSRGPQGIRDRIKATAVNWGAPGADIDFGSGRLDAYAAIRSAGPQTRGLVAPPPVPAHRVFEGRFPEGEGKVCRYPLEISDARRPLAASLIVSGWIASAPGKVDFDLKLRDPAGKLVAGDTSIERQNDLTHRPAGPGRYTLEVRRASGGGDFVTDVSAGLSSQPSTAPATCS
jgi:serine protease AprX